MATNNKANWADDLTTKYIKENAQVFAKLTDDVVKRINENLYSSKELKVFKDMTDKQLEEMKNNNIG